MDWENQLATGVYSIPEAARLTGVSAGRIRRWLRGYRHSAGSGTSPPGWEAEIPEVQGHAALSFRDLMEVRFVDAYLRHGVKWSVIRRAAETAAEIIHSSHPFATRRFKTDGQTIFAELAREHQDSDLLDLASGQYNIFEFVNPGLFEGIEFGPNDNASRWYPLWPNRRVVIDPRLSFGQPIIESTGVPTYVLAGAAQAEGSPRQAAKIYEVSPQDVESAVEMETRLAA